jgi:hypothetical protein
MNGQIGRDCREDIEAIWKRYGEDTEKIRRRYGEDTEKIFPGLFILSLKYF